MVYERCTIYGPYEDTDGRKRVNVVFPNGTMTTIAYARYLVECNIGSYLAVDKEVHHKNEDKTDDSFENLEVKDKTEHKADHQRKYYDIIQSCDYCGNPFVWTAKQQAEFTKSKRKSKTGRGPYCRKWCSGKANSEIR